MDRSNDRFEILCLDGRWYPDVYNGVDHFVGYVKVLISAAEEGHEHPQVFELWLWWTQPTPPYHRFATPVDVIDLSSTTTDGPSEEAMDEDDDAKEETPLSPTRVVVPDEAPAHVDVGTREVGTSKARRVPWRYEGWLDDTDDEDDSVEDPAYIAFLKARGYPIE